MHILKSIIGEWEIRFKGMDNFNNNICCKEKLSENQKQKLNFLFWELKKHRFYPRARDITSTEKIENGILKMVSNNILIINIQINIKPI